jgi:hypothetical protein
MQIDQLKQREFMSLLGSAAASVALVRSARAAAGNAGDRDP